MGIALVAAVLALSGTQQEKRITLDIEGATVSAAVKQIADSTGESLFVTPAADRNTLVLHVHDEPVQDLLERIAQATQCEWVESKSGKALTLTDSARAKRKASEDALRAAAIQKAIDRLPQQTADRTEKELEELVGRAEDVGKTLEDHMPTEVQRTLMYDIRMDKPSTWLVNSIVRTIGADQLSQIHEGRQMVFSTSPVGDEKPIPGSIHGAVGRYQKEFAVWRAAVLRSVAVYPVKNYEDPRSTIHADHGSPSVYWVTVGRRNGSQDLTAELFVADDQGRIVDMSYATLTAELDKDVLLIDPDRSLRVPRQLREAQACLMLKQTIATSAGPSPIADGWNKVIADPVKTDPIALGIGPLLIAVAKTTNKDLVACVPDSALFWYFGGVQPVPETWTVNGAFEQASQSWGVHAEEASGWLVLSPRFPDDASADYLDRAAMRDLFSAQLHDGLVSIRTAEDYARRQASPLAFGWYDGRVTVVNRDFVGNVGDSRLIDLTSAGLLRILANLNTNESRLASDGVPVGALSSRAWSAVEDWLTAAVTTAHSFRKPDSQTFTPADLQSMSTRVIAGPLARMMRLKIHRSTEQMTFRKTVDGIDRPFADLLEYSGHIYQDAVDATPGVLAQMGTLQRVTVRLELPDGRNTSWDLYQALAPPDENKWVQPKDLPPEALQVLKRAQDERPWRPIGS